MKELSFNRSTLKEEEVFFVVKQNRSFEEQMDLYNKKTNVTAERVKLQYLAIEESLLRAFKYVMPVNENINTSSENFASIIRESSNLFEVLCRDVFFKLFEVEEKKKKYINIAHYLSLDKILNYSNIELYSPTLSSCFNDTRLLKPFAELEQWDREKSISDDYETLVPVWWKAYNKIKHEVEGVFEYATFKNAILSVGASYCIIKSIYGDGLVGGILMKPHIEEDGSMSVDQYFSEVSKLFFEFTFRLTY